MDDVIIYTDGSVSGNGKPDAVGGWACILQAVRNSIITAELERSGQLLPDTKKPVTSIRAEMYAVINCLKSIQDTCKINIFCDNEVVVKGYNGEYDKKANFDLWNDIIQLVFLLEEMGCKVSIQWVKGHSDNVMNKRVDKLAKDAKEGKTVDKFIKF